MVIIRTDFSLKRFNTFGIDVKANRFADIFRESDIVEIRKQTASNEQILFLGSGSNILFTKNFNGVVIKNSIKGIEEKEFGEDEIIISAGGGTEWNDLVNYAASKNYWGIENLALIPGTVGAAPIQNIGAYGAELKDVFHSLEGYNFDSGEKIVFTKDECEFKYRWSIFKGELRNKFLIAKVNFVLNKKPSPNLTYAALRDELNRVSNSELTPLLISETVSKIRRNKLPDPAKIGNAGSFFKNPKVKNEKFAELQNQFHNIPKFESEQDGVKIPAAWLIEKCGFKGKRIGNVGTHKNQPLVIVNFGETSGRRIQEFSVLVQKAVYEKFNILLEHEVNIY
ncbi:MAG: UDP-N-acetylmuramate dehydrogenase [Bacteroidetes bacterium]|nr:UDP-N-acetylmuramate dehydrogenase [Bacteroidota bacterium]